ncbi:carboxylic acid reductase [Mycobacterium sp. 1245801.1]|uniref:carboxylic acid reductase n=1 Tax=Mycobacterium sp. 1245801.1 TaxID=1834075 RepID=UPI0008002DC8|nr:carboxylic acid reductase [Mycobacterium sp. 1245801.1]OBJ22732.1 oxidoreductase [Mycobacterium sp. 1245801.1]
MASDATRQLGAPADSNEERRARRIRELCASDPQFRSAMPIPQVLEAARQPGLRLPQVIETLVKGYAGRPMFGQRARQQVTDPQTGRTSSRLLPSFTTLTYGELWARARAIATAWCRNTHYRLSPGDFVATVGFASSDYVAIDVACAYAGWVSVPLQHNASVAQLRSILSEAKPRVLAVSAEYLDTAVQAALGGEWLRHLVVFDYLPVVDDHQESYERALALLHAAVMPVQVQTLNEVISQGSALPAEPAYLGADEARLAMILYTSGSTGAPKGAMYTEAMTSRLWTMSFPAEPDAAVFSVNFLPLHHLGGRIALLACIRAGGTTYFAAGPELSTLFEDWALVRPTELYVVPRVIEMLIQRFRTGVDRLRLEGADDETAQAQAADELRQQLLGGRVLGGFIGTAPLATEMRTFIESRLQVHLVDGYGLTEVGGITKDGVVLRPPVVKYKLVDVPELGYFRTDKPYPRGELLVKSTTSTPGYYNHPEITAAVFDEDGFYRTGDVMAEVGPDHLVYVDRRNNVLKLSQGEFVAVANLEALYATAPLIRQIFVYGNSERSSLLAVIVPTVEALAHFDGDLTALKSALRDSLRETAKASQLQPYEIPVDYLIETEPFTTANGLLSGVGKLLRPNLNDRYGERLELLYIELAALQQDKLGALHRLADDLPVIEIVIRAVGLLLGTDPVDRNDHFTDLGGDSLSALSFSTLLQEIFGVEVPVGVLIGPANSLQELANFIETQRQSSSERASFTRVHGRAAEYLHASDLTLDKFIDTKTLDRAAALSIPAVGEPRTVLLTGATGYLGRFLCLEWLQRLACSGGKLVCLLRAGSTNTAQVRLNAVFDTGDPVLLRRFHELAADHLDVVVGDMSEPDLGLDEATWDRLAQTVDMIVHPGALVNHVLPYEQLFGPNVVGTAALIRLAITQRMKPVNYVSTVAVSMSVPDGEFIEDGDIRVVSPVRPNNGSYANGYANSKWAGEVLLRNAHDRYSLPVNVFRPDMILAHSEYLGQVNVVDAFTRLVFSLLVTGIAPQSFYQKRNGEFRPRAHYDGLPADFVAESICKLSGQLRDGFHSFDVLNPYDDGISLDVFVDWLIASGHSITRIPDYHEWLTRFRTAMTALPERQRQYSVLALLEAYHQPQAPLRGAPVPTEVFHAAVRATKVGPDKDIPHIGRPLIDKYITDLRHLGLL